jgi:hypothetical protein
MPGEHAPRRSVPFETQPLVMHELITNQGKGTLNDAGEPREDRFEC